MRKLIQRYEYETIAIGEEGFTEAHFNALRIWNERNGGNYFEERHRKLKCKQFVGVVQVGQVVIEILPKADRNTDDKQRWRKALLTMLRKVHGLRLHTPDDADQALRHTNLMDLFLEAYVQEVRVLVHLGLVKKYHARSGNQPALKGRLDFPRHLRQNLVHKERFAVAHQTYDTDHLLHSILKEALDIVRNTCTNAGITGRAQDVSWAFENARARRITAETFTRIRLDRKTAPYAPALQFARLIILQNNPDMRAGHEPVLSILFDMEKLWEKFIHRLLVEHCPEGWTIDGQRQLPFWENHPLKPDLLFTFKGSVRLIGDTKWKVPEGGDPSPEDLRQMFAYNLRFVSERSVLLYPGAQSGRRGDYVNHKKGWHSTPHGCEVRFMMPFNDQGGIDAGFVRELARELLTHVEAPVA